jgi:hypothetical protein
MSKKLSCTWIGAITAPPGTIVLALSKTKCSGGANCSKLQDPGSRLWLCFQKKAVEL